MNQNFSPKSNASAATQSSPRAVDARILATMIKRLHDPVVARIFLSTLETYPDLQVQFLGSFLKAQETVKRSQMRYAKARDFGIAFVQAKNSAIRLCLLLGRGCSKFVFLLKKLHAKSNSPKESREVPQPASSNVICLPVSYKATGTDC